MTDLHTHILPGMDDGAKDLTSALALLELEHQQGVCRIALTSHYHCETEAPAAFLERRDRSFARLRAAAAPDMTLKCGCEVFFSPELLNIDVSMLCLEGTKYLLLELPILQKPAFLHHVLCGLISRGVVPVIAHVERYLYVRREPGLLLEWIGLGALIQVNAGSLNGSDAAFVRALIKSDLVHILASDTHDCAYRPPVLHQGLQLVRRGVGEEKAMLLQQNADLIFSGGTVLPMNPRIPRRFFGFWF